MVNVFVIMNQFNLCTSLLFLEDADEICLFDDLDYICLIVASYTYTDRFVCICVFGHKEAV